MYTETQQRMKRMVLGSEGLPSAQRLAEGAGAVLRRLLPAGWDLEIVREPLLGDGYRPDIMIEIISPDREQVTFVGEVKRRGTGAAARGAIDQLRKHSRVLPEVRPLFVAPWLSARSRDLLAEANVAYLDATGNARLVVEKPGLFITAQGEDKNPWPDDSSLKSLRGKGTARAVRALVDHRPPYGIRELAERTEASAATLSRVVDLLEGEALVERDSRGGVMDVNWEGTIRRWSQDYDVQETNDASNWLLPRGLGGLGDSLRSTSMWYALTGSLAAQEFAPYAPARLAMIYVDSMVEAAEALGLREVDSGTNVVLLAPFDEVVYARTLERSGLTVVNPSQLAADLLTSPGRAPSEGEELLGWMGRNTDAWRA